MECVRCSSNSALLKLIDLIYLIFHVNKCRFTTSNISAVLFPFNKFNYSLIWKGFAWWAEGSVAPNDWKLDHFPTSCGFMCFIRLLFARLRVKNLEYFYFHARRLYRGPRFMAIDSDNHSPTHYFCSTISFFNAIITWLQTLYTTNNVRFRGVSH